jgi:hypothetical protein
MTQYDNALATYVYNKIWDEMSDTDRWYMTIIASLDNQTVKCSDILTAANKSKNEFSQYRVRLANKGILDISKRGYVTIGLPRFIEYINSIV